MASTEAKKRVEDLLELSVQLVGEQDTNGAVRALKEAQTIEPGNDRISAALRTLALKDTSENVGNAGNGEKLSISTSTIVATFSPDPTKVFKELWTGGDAAIKTLIDSVLDPNVWPSESQRNKAELDAFALLLAKLFEPNLINSERAMRAIARLLAVDAEKLQQLIDADTFATIASFLHIKNAISLRTQTTLAIAKFLEAAPERGQGLLTNFVVLRMSGQDYDTLIVALSAASAMFPFVRKAAVALFLTNGFCDNLIAVSDRSSNPDVTQAVLELLNAACIEQPCREAISKSPTCIAWLQDKLEPPNKSIKERAFAAVILSKISKENPEVLPRKHEPVKLFKGWIKSADHDSIIPIAVEGLMFETLSSKAKEDLASDAQTLTSLTNILSQPNVAFLFAGLSIFLNLTEYPEQMSQEGQKLAELKSYANAKAKNTRAKRPEPDVLNDDQHVTERCKKVLDADIIPALVAHSREPSPTVLRAITSIALAVSKHPRNRGKMAQQGCFKMALELSNVRGQGEDLEIVRREGALILAHILIPIDPNLLFSGNNARAIPQAIRPLLQLLTTPYPTPSGSKDLRPLMESLRAFTNLATVTNGPNMGNAQDLIFGACWPLVPNELATHHHSAIRRAAVQLVCNMASHVKVQHWFGERASRTRQIVALTQAEDEETALGAGGAVAGLTADEAVVGHLVNWERGMPIVIEMLGMGEGMMARGMAVVGNLAVADQGKTALRDGGAVKALQDLLMDMEGKKDVEGLVNGLKALIKDLSSQ